MTEKELNAALNALGTLFSGEIKITKETGTQEIEMEYTMHPIFTLFCIAQAEVTVFWDAMHTEDDLQLHFDSREKLHEVVSGIAEQVEAELWGRMEEET